MSNIIPVVQGGMPAYLQQANLPVASNLGAGISAHAPRLGITITREFTLTKNGQTQILPPSPSSDGRTLRNAVRCVILGAAPTLNKAWFSKPYAPGSDVVPDCYSDDGQVPVPTAEHKQSQLCGACPKNAFGSHPITGRGKACSDRKRVVLALESDPETAVLINWPTMSLGALKNLDASLQQGHIPLQALMVELSFDLTVQYSKIMVNPVGFVPEETFHALKALAELSTTQELLREAAYDDADAPAAPAALQPPAYLQPLGYGPAQAAAEPAATVAPAPVQQYEAPAHVVPAADPTEGEPAKRKRRTKAEMEATRAAEAAALAGAPQTTSVQAPAPAVEVVPAAPAAQPAPAVPGMTPEMAEQFRQFQAIQVLKALQAQQDPVPAPVVQAAFSQVVPVVQAAPAQVIPAPAPAAAPPAHTTANVMDLIGRWKQNN